MVHMTRRRIVGSLAAALVALAAFAGPASAAYDEFWNGYLNGAVNAPWHTLTEASVRSVDGGFTCIAAYNRDGTRAGDPSCTSGVNGLATHPYCGCQLRMGRASAAPATIRARVTF